MLQKGARDTANAAFSPALQVHWLVICMNIQRGNREPQGCSQVPNDLSRSEQWTESVFHASGETPGIQGSVSCESRVPDCWVMALDPPAYDSRNFFFLLSSSEALGAKGILMFAPKFR